MSNTQFLDYVGIKGYWRRRDLKKARKCLVTAVDLMTKNMDINGGTMATFDYLVRRINKELEAYK